MNQIIYQEKIVLLTQPEFSLVPFMPVIASFLETDYGLSGIWRETHAAREDDGTVLFRYVVLGDEQGALLSHSYQVYNEIYSGVGNVESLRSHRLTHLTTGETLQIYIEITRLLYTSDELKLTFEGEESEVEKLKEAVKPLLEPSRIRLREARAWRNEN